MFTVAMFPVTLQVAPDKTASQNASAVKVNNFSISKRAIPMEERRMEGKKRRESHRKELKGGGQDGREVEMEEDGRGGERE